MAALAMSLRRTATTAVRMTIATTVLLGVGYPLLVTGLAQLMFPERANGDLVVRGGTVVGAKMIGQTFSSAAYFHGRPSAAGKGYDAANSGGSNLGPTSRELVETVAANVRAAQPDNAHTPVPVDLVTGSASGLDPHLSPSAALFQVPRVARSRHISESEVRQLVVSRIEPRQLGFLGEPRVNVLLLNLALDERYPRRR